MNLFVLHVPEDQKENPEVVRTCDYLLSIHHDVADISAHILSAVEGDQVAYLIKSCVQYTYHIVHVKLH